MSESTTTTYPYFLGNYQILLTPDKKNACIEGKGMGETLYLASSSKLSDRYIWYSYEDLYDTKYLYFVEIKNCRSINYEVETSQRQYNFAEGRWEV